MYRFCKGLHDWQLSLSLRQLIEALESKRIRHTDISCALVDRSSFQSKNIKSNANRSKCFVYYAGGESLIIRWNSKEFSINLQKLKQTVQRPSVIRIDCCSIGFVYFAFDFSVNIFLWLVWILTIADITYKLWQWEKWKKNLLQCFITSNMKRTSSEVIAQDYTKECIDIRKCKYTTCMPCPSCVSGAVIVLIRFTSKAALMHTLNFLMFLLFTF